jgi:hypothetical protein
MRSARMERRRHDVVDGGVNDVDGEAWTTLGHAWLGSDLRGTTTER